MSKIKSCAYRHVVLTCPVNNGSVAHGKKLERAKLTLQKKIKKWEINAKIGDKFMK
jgi:hypothetical protein